MVYSQSSAYQQFKAGVDLSGESFNSAEEILLAGSAPFTDNGRQYGRNLGAYVEDKWTPSDLLSMQFGLRYDFSNGYVEGNELQPRVGLNYKLGPDTVFHTFYGRVYAAPTLEDTRRDAVIIGGGSPSALPVYDLKPEHDSYYEMGIGQTFRNGLYGYVNAWERNAWNVLDTTQIFPTPIFAVYNNSLGLAKGLELRLEQRGLTDSWFISASDSQSNAGGISGGTFLFPPSVISDNSLQPEDHDQTVAIKDEYIKHFGDDARTLCEPRKRLWNRVSGRIPKRQRPVDAASDLRCGDRKGAAKRRSRLESERAQLHELQVRDQGRERLQHDPMVPGRAGPLAAHGSHSVTALSSRAKSRDREA